MTDKLHIELRRAHEHLTLLEQNATHPLEFLNPDYPTAPPLILRPGEKLRTAHSEVGISHGDIREAMILALRLRVDDLMRKLEAVEPGFNLSRLQYGDQTEA